MQSTTNSLRDRFQGASNLKIDNRPLEKHETITFKSPSPEPNNHDSIQGTPTPEIDRKKLRPPKIVFKGIYNNEGESSPE